MCEWWSARATRSNTLFSLISRLHDEVYRYTYSYKEERLFKIDITTMVIFFGMYKISCEIEMNHECAMNQVTRRAHSPSCANPHAYLSPGTLSFSRQYRALCSRSGTLSSANNFGKTSPFGREHSTKQRKKTFSVTK